MSEMNIEGAVEAPNPTEAFNAEITTETNPANDDVAKRIQDARKQEKDKLYPQLEKLQEELAVLRKEREERSAVEADRLEKRKAKEAERAAERQAQLEEEMSFKQLLKSKEQEWQSQLDAVKAESQTNFALLQREREFQELMSYRNQRIEQERDSIVPSLIDFVKGENRDEIEQSILDLKARSEQILNDFAQASQQSRKNMVGASVTAPTSGPLENDPSQLAYNPGNIANMSLADYAKNRDRLLGSAGNNGGRGLFG